MERTGLTSYSYAFFICQISKFLLSKNIIDTSTIGKTKKQHKIMLKNVLDVTIYGYT